MVSHAVQMYRNDEQHHLADGEHGASSFNNFTTKGGLGTFDSIAHKTNDDKSNKAESILLRNMQQEMLSNSIIPASNKESFIQQAINFAFDKLGISAIERRDAMSMVQNVVEKEGFKTPTNITEHDSQSLVQQKIVEANPNLFATSTATNEPVKLSEFKDTFGEACEMPAGLATLCDGNGLPAEAASIVFLANMQIDMVQAPAPTITAANNPYHKAAPVFSLNQ